MEQSPSVRSDNLSDAKNFLCFKKLRGSSPRAENSATGPCCMSGESRSLLNVLSLKETSYIYTENFIFVFFVLRVAAQVGLYQGDRYEMQL